MVSRRQEKVARIVKESVSEAVLSHLSDPRICGFVSVTRVEMSPDLRNANVYFSIFGGDEKLQKKTFTGLVAARVKIQSFVAGHITSKFCPVLHFNLDEGFKKTLETFNIIDKAVSEFKDEEPE